MKTFVAYALVVIGIPIFAGLLLGSIVSIPISRLLRMNTKVSLASLDYLEAFNGFGASVVAVLLFRLFAMIPNWTVFGIMVAWITFYFLAYRQSFRAWFSCLIGMIIGWFVILRFF